MITYSSVEIAYRWLSHRYAGWNKAEHKHAAQFRRRCRRWLDDPNVRGIGVGVKIVAGVATPVPALCVYVGRKNKRFGVVEKQVPPVLYLPGNLRPVLTDVVVLPHARAACRAGGHIRNKGAPQDAGTATAYLEKVGEPGSCYLLGCAHVLAPAGAKTGDVIECAHPNWTSAGVLTSRYAKLKFGQTSSLPDYAIVGIDSPTPPDLTLANAAVTIASPVRSQVSQGETLTIYGRINPTPRQVTVTSPASKVQITYAPPGGGVVTFLDMIITTKGSAGGDSGAPVLDQDRRPVGYIVGDNSTSSFIQLAAPILADQSMRLYGAGGDDFANVLNTAGNPVAPTLSVSGAIDTLARTIWGEARGESMQGRIAVAWVVLNRANDAQQRFDRTVEKVCTAPKQFSCWNANDPNLAKLKAVTDTNLAFRECLDVASRAVSGKLPPDPTGGANHYHATSLTPLPKWAKNVAPTATIGSHVFYRL